MRGDEAVQVHVDQGQAHHVGGDVVALEVGRQSAFVVRRERVVAVFVHVGAKNVFVGRDEEAGSAASRVKDGFVFLRVKDGNNEVDDMAWGAELAGVTL